MVLVKSRQMCTLGWKCPLWFVQHTFKCKGNDSLLPTTGTLLVEAGNVE
jgi:hypothetical protein